MSDVDWHKWGRKNMIQAVMDDIREHPEYHKPLDIARRIRAISIRFGIMYDKAKEYVELSM